MPLLTGTASLLGSPAGQVTWLHVLDLDWSITAGLEYSSATDPGLP